jgi:hypothetical protein
MEPSEGHSIEGFSLACSVSSAGSSGGKNAYSWIRETDTDPFSTCPMLYEARAISIRQKQTVQNGRK